MPTNDDDSSAIQQESIEIYVDKVENQISQHVGNNNREAERRRRCASSITDDELEQEQARITDSSEDETENRLLASMKMGLYEVVFKCTFQVRKSNL